MQKKILEKILLDMMLEDQGTLDITAVFTPNKDVAAEILSKSDGYVSGIYELKVLFGLFDIGYKKLVKDGDSIKSGQKIFELSGNARDILVAERVALNILARMSAITTLTRAYVDLAREANSEIRIAATRKTMPLFRYFQKKAVRIGGGDTHRTGLYDCVMLKDNHLAVFGGDIKKALETAKKATSFAHKIDIEVTTSEDAVLAAENGADIIMLDNMLPEKIKETVSILEKKKLRSRVILEASGGVTLDNVKDYANTGVDVISIGRLTYSASSMDFSLRINKE